MGPHILKDLITAPRLHCDDLGQHAWTGPYLLYLLLDLISIQKDEIDPDPAGLPGLQGSSCLADVVSFNSAISAMQNLG